MTCIVGMLNGNGVTIGADSAGVSGTALVIRKDPKVFINGDFLIGCTSSFRMIQLLQYSLKVEKRPTKMDVHEYMCTTFIDSVRKTFKDGGYLQKETDGEEKGGLFLVGYEGRLFKIDTDFQVGESFDGFESVGCGDDFALGSLCTTRGILDMSVEERITLALKVASERSSGVRPPFILKTI